MKRIIIELTTWCGQCVEAIHYYACVAYYDKDNQYCSDKIQRPLTQEEIEKDPDRWLCYTEGDLTQGFNSWREALAFAQSHINNKSIEGEVFVDGIPNKGVLSIEQALSPTLDTRKKCSKCGKVFGNKEGIYNYPSGALCVKCNNKAKK